MSKYMINISYCPAILPQLKPLSHLISTSNSNNNICYLPRLKYDLEILH